MLETKAVTKEFGGLTAAKDINIKIGAHELVGLIGPNGAGKTTLFNVITGFYQPTSGRILFEGQDITGYKPHRSTYLGLGRTFQITRPFGRLTVLDNVVVGALCREKSLPRAKELAWEIITQVGLAEKALEVAQSLPLGLRKKLELARILAIKPRLVLLDEVMGGLSPQEVSDLSVTISDIHAKGVGVLMIEHVMSAVMKLCQRIVVIHLGQEIATGTPLEIRSNRAVIDAYLGDNYCYESEKVA